MAVKRPKGSPEKIGRLISSRLAGSALGARLKDLEIWQVWAQVVGPAIAGRTSPLRLSGGQLTVMVSGAPWMQQLNFMKAELCDKLNSCLGDERVQEIVFKAGRISKPSESTDDQDTTPMLRQLSSQQRSWIEQQVTAVDDPELAASLASLMELHYRRRF